MVPPKANMLAKGEKINTEALKKFARFRKSRLSCPISDSSDFCFIVVEMRLEFDKLLLRVKRTRSYELRDCFERFAEFDAHDAEIQDKPDK